MFNLWMVWRYLKARRRLFSLTTLLAIVGMSIGVASMVVAMAVVSGYETTLKRSIIDIVGHVLVVKRGTRVSTQNEMVDSIKPFVPSLEAYTPFVTLDAALTHNRKLSGVVLQGVDPETVDKVLRIRSRLVEGQFEFTDAEGEPGALIGKGLAKKFALNIGDEFKVVMPVSQGYDSENFRPKVKKFTVTGIVDIGRHDFDTRYVMVGLNAAQDFAGLGDRITGIRLKLAKDEDAELASVRISNELGYPYWTRSWVDINHNLFEAARIEKMVIFFVLLVMIVAAAFNIAGTLFFSVMQRYSDISILKAMGARRGMILRLFTYQGLVIGFIGTVLGFILGFLACYGFLYAQQTWGLISGEIYKLDRIEVEFRLWDFLAIFAASLLICFVSTLAPARRGARLTPTEGLRYE